MTKQVWVEPRLEELPVDQTLGGIPTPLGEGFFTPTDPPGPPVPIS